MNNTDPSNDGGDGLCQMAPITQPAPSSNGSPRITDEQMEEHKRLFYEALDKRYSNEHTKPKFLT